MPKKILSEKDLHDYQRLVVQHILDNDAAGLFLDMGLGKTVSTLTAVKKLMYEELDIMSALVIAPKRVTESVWHTEIKKWAHLQRLTYSRVIGNEKERLAALNRKVDIHLIGRDNVAWLCGLYGGNMLPWDMLIIDESSSFKNHKSIRFKALRLVMASFTRVVILTGTPSPNGLQDIWSQIFLLDHGTRLGRFITKFRKEYFRNISRSSNYEKLEIVSDGEQRIYDKISDICISMKAEDYLSLPGRINRYVELDMPPKLEEKYKEFEKEQVLELFDRPEAEITAVNAAALLNKLLQFSNGAVYEDHIIEIDEEGEVIPESRIKKWHPIHNLKIDALKDILEAASGKPVLVAWTYRHDLYRIQKALKDYKPRELKTNKDIEDWNDGKVQLLLMHPASGGHGLNLQAGGNIIVWFGQTWSLELYQQLNARLDRQGQTEITIIHHLITKGTVDNRVIKALDFKSKGQDSLMAAVKASIAKYLK